MCLKNIQNMYPAIQTLGVKFKWRWRKKIANLIIHFCTIPKFLFHFIVITWHLKL
jgi:hypothetical protein